MMVNLVMSYSCDPWTIAHRILCPWDFPGKNTGVVCHFLLQGIFPTQRDWTRVSEKAVAPYSRLLPGKSHGRRSWVGCSPWDCEESDTTERLHFHFSLTCIGEGNGNPLQCSCLENPRDKGAWRAAVYGVAQSQTRLKQLSSSSSSFWTAGRFLTDWATRETSEYFWCFLI